MNEKKCVGVQSRILIYSFSPINVNRIIYNTIILFFNIRVFKIKYYPF